MRNTGEDVAPTHATFVRFENTLGGSATTNRVAVLAARRLPSRVLRNFRFLQASVVACVRIAPKHLKIGKASLVGVD